MRSSNVCWPATARRSAPSTCSSNPTSGWASARVTTASPDARVSLAAERRNLRRAGVLKKRVRTTTVVPRWRTASDTRSRRPPLTLSSVPESPSEVVSVRRETDAMAGSASPRKPKVATPTRSAALRTLLVA
jgi:hypothetical protein